MILLAVTADTWMVTGLGFGIVLILLFAFVYVMKGLGAVMGRTAKQATPKVAPATKEDKPTTNNATAEEMAAVAMAMDLYFNSLHDVQAPHLTIRHHDTMWNKK